MTKLNRSSISAIIAGAGVVAGYKLLTSFIYWLYTLHASDLLVTAVVLQLIVVARHLFLSISDPDTYFNVEVGQHDLRYRTPKADPGRILEGSDN